MVVEYDEEFFSIKLRHNIGEPPYEVIDIVDLLEVWEQHKADTPQTDCDKCIWSVCNYNKVDWEADTPQTERKSCKLELFDDDGNYIEPQTEEGK